MAAVQIMCARIGKVTGLGLAANFKQRFPRWLLLVFVVALLIANTINIAADLAGMADASAMLSGINSHWFVIVFALLIPGQPSTSSISRSRTSSSGWSLSSSPIPLPRLSWEPIGPGAARYSGAFDAAYQN